MLPAANQTSVCSLLAYLQIMPHPSIADHEESADDRDLYVNTSRKPSQTGTPTLGGVSTSGVTTTAGGSPPTSSGVAIGAVAGKFRPI